LRSEAHRQDPDAYPEHRPAFVDYDPYPSTIADLAAELERGLAEAIVSG
jgi:hypothetical protein